MNVQAQVEIKVSQRYAEGAKQRQEGLCCPVDYDASLLELLPQEIIDRDYGCGDPSRYVKAGDTVLDLGSGGGSRDRRGSLRHLHRCRRGLHHRSAHRRPRAKAEGGDV